MRTAKQRRNDAIDSAILWIVVGGGMMISISGGPLLGRIAKMCLVAGAATIGGEIVKEFPVTQDREE